MSACANEKENVARNQYLLSTLDNSFKEDVQDCHLIYRLACMMCILNDPE